LDSYSYFYLCYDHSHLPVFLLTRVYSADYDLSHIFQNLSDAISLVVLWFWCPYSRVLEWLLHFFVRNLSSIILASTHANSVFQGHHRIWTFLFSVQHLFSLWILQFLSLFPSISNPNQQDLHLTQNTLCTVYHTRLRLISIAGLLFVLDLQLNFQDYLIFHPILLRILTLFSTPQCILRILFQRANHFSLLSTHDVLNTLFAALKLNILSILHLCCIFHFQA